MCLCGRVLMQWHQIVKQLAVLDVRLQFLNHPIIEAESSKAAASKIFDEFEFDLYCALQCFLFFSAPVGM
jgi:hypothetical protein